MTKLSTKILEKIRKEKMIPKSRYYFILMHTLLGTAILSSVMIGGIAIAIVIRHLTLTDWELAHQFTGSHIRSALLIAPYIWLIFIGISILLADTLYKHTKKGYRLKLWQLIMTSVILSFVFGGTFYVTKADKPIEFSLSKKIPSYAEWKIKKAQIFVAPEKGVIAGEIIAIDEDEKMTIVDFKEKKWIIEKGEMRSRNEKPFEVGMQVGIIGETTNHEHFKAIRIAPWKQDFRPGNWQQLNIRKIPERNF
ncbi:hypothetical protein JXD20_04285 [Candidatus Peregrinibacteria bacterium]|nr:hypothetical protein [Candidatus Peregrinibacteria bacterium]